jgi:hypothetical protein
VILPVCYGHILTSFPNCDGHGYSPDPFCTACLGWWYAPIGTSWPLSSISPIMFVFNSFLLGGMMASVYIAIVCLCGSEPVPRAVWAKEVPRWMLITFLLGYFAFLVLAKFYMFPPRRAPAQDSSNELSETATSSLMSNQATPEVHVMPNNTPVHVPVVLTPMAPNLAPNVPVAPNLAPNVPVAVHVPMAPALVQTFPKAVHVTMAQHDHMAPTVPVAPNGPETVSCTVSPLQCPPEGRPAPKASCVDAWGLD